MNPLCQRNGLRFAAVVSGLWGWGDFCSHVYTFRSFSKLSEISPCYCKRWEEITSKRTSHFVQCLVGVFIQLGIEKLWIKRVQLLFSFPCLRGPKLPSCGTLGILPVRAWCLQENIFIPGFLLQTRGTQNTSPPLPLAWIYLTLFSLIVGVSLKWCLEGARN